MFQIFGTARNSEPRVPSFIFAFRIPKIGKAFRTKNRQGIVGLDDNALPTRLEMLASTESNKSKAAKKPWNTIAKTIFANRVPLPSWTTREEFYITSRCRLDCLEAQTNYNCVLSRDIMAEAKRRETCLLCVDQVPFSFSSLPMSFCSIDFINVYCILLQMASLC